MTQNMHLYHIMYGENNIYSITLSKLYYYGQFKFLNF